MTLRAYAEPIGVNEQTVHTWKKAAEVAVMTGHNFAEITDCLRHLAAIHAAPEATWQSYNRDNPFFHYAPAACVVIRGFFLRDPRPDVDPTHFCPCHDVCGVQAGLLDLSTRVNTLKSFSALSGTKHTQFSGNPQNCPLPRKKPDKTGLIRGKTRAAGYARSSLYKFHLSRQIVRNIG